MPLLPPSQLNVNGGAGNESGYGASSMVIKARLGNDVRKIAVHNSDMTHDELLLMMQRIFKGRISPADNVTLKYADEDGDLVTITDDSDLTFAMQTERVLKLTLFINDQPQPLEADELKRIRQELVHIRDVSNKLLDSIAPERSHPSANAERTAAAPAAPAAPAVPEVKKPPMNYMDGLETSREFDPLSQRQPASNGSTRDSLPSTPVVHDIALNDKPPSVFGVGTQEASRPDTPNSQHSRRSGSVAEFGQQENVATIQPTVHQQINAGQPPVHMGAPIFSSANPVPPAPPSTFDYQHQNHQQQQHHAPQQQQQQQHQYPQQQYPAQPFAQQQQQQPQPPGPTPPVSTQSIFPPHSAPSLPPTSVPAAPASMAFGAPPAVGDPSNRPAQFGQHPPPPSGHPQHGHADGQSAQPPQQHQQVPSYQHSPGFLPQQQQQQQQQQPQQQHQHHPAPPQAAQGMPPVGLPPMGPPMSFAAPGVNPFARGPSPGSNPYVRPSFPGGFQ